MHCIIHRRKFCVLICAHQCPSHFHCGQADAARVLVQQSVYTMFVCILIGVSIALNYKTLINYVRMCKVCDAS